MNWPDQRPSNPGMPQYSYSAPQVTYQHQIPQFTRNVKEAYDQWRQGKVSELQQVFGKAVNDYVEKLAQVIQTNNDSLNQELRDMKSAVTSKFELLSGGLKDCQDTVSSHLKDIREEGQAAKHEEQRQQQQQTQQTQQTQRLLQQLADEMRHWRTDQDRLVRVLIERVESNERNMQVLNETVLKQMQVLTSQKLAARDEMTAAWAATQDKLSAVLASQENMLRLFEPSDDKEHQVKRKTRSQSRQSKQDSGNELQNMPPILRGAFEGAVKVLLGTVKGQSCTTTPEKTTRNSPRRIKEENEPKRKRQRRG